jgi:hypothetical protein
VTPERFVERPTIASEAVETFGVDAVNTAYEELADFALDVAFREEFLDPQRVDYTAEELTAEVQPRLGPGALETWNAQVTAALEGDPDAQDALRILQFYRWDQPTWTVPAGGALQSQRISSAEIALAEPEPEAPPRLLVRLQHAATMEYEEDGGTFRIEVAKPMRFWLVQSEWTTGPRWLVYAYEGSFQVRPLQR